jgi:hypothetical protein
MLDDPYWFRSLMFPMVTAFLIALSFGVGCRHWRAWWSYEGLDESQALKLRAKIQKKYGSDTDVDRCFIPSVSVLDKMTPIEALRYEDYRVKLFRQVEKTKIREFFDIKLKPAENVEATVTNAGHALQPAEERGPRTCSEKLTRSLARPLTRASQISALSSQSSAKLFTLTRTLVAIGPVSPTSSL